MEPQLWAEYPRHNGYVVSSHGRVLGVERGRLLTPYLHKGYPSINIGGTRPIQLGRLVLLTFGGDPPEGKNHAAHRDGDRFNNYLSNMYWASPADNNADKQRHGRYTRGVEHVTTKLTPEQVLSIRKMYANGLRNKELAALYEVTTGAIGGIVYNKTWRHLLPEAVA